MRPFIPAAAYVLWVLMPDGVFAQSVPPAQPSANEVRVVLKDGSSRTGRLLTLDTSTVGIRQSPTARETRYQLSDVKLVETVHHNKRNLVLAGTAIGMGLALAGDWCGEGQPYGASREPGCITPMPALVTAAAMALGAAIGHGIDRRKRKILFATPPGSLVRPYVLLSGKPLGVGIAIQW